MTLAAVLAVLAAHNLGIERLRRAWYVPACNLTAIVLVGLAGAEGLGRRELGLSATGAGAGLVAGSATAAAVAGAALLPAARPFLADRRMAGVGAGGTAYRVLVRIPLGTVVVEEVAFRGVLPAMTGNHVAPAVLFGLWHVVPVRAALRTNGRPCRAAPVAAAAALTAAVGAGLGWLRLATGGLAAPAIVHAAASGAATVMAARAVRG